MLMSRVARRYAKAAPGVAPTARPKVAAPVLPGGLRLSAVPAFPAASPPRLHRKLAIGASHDASEKEADRVADRVMAGADAAISSPAAAPRLDRRCAACDGEEEAPVQAKAAPGAAAAGEAPAIVHEVLSSTGQPIEPAARAFFESRFRTDFGGVRVHVGPRAAESAGAVNARAYTVGSDIAFADGAYRPGSRDGRELIAHELAHVVQQGGAGRQGRAGGAAALQPTLRRANRNAVRQVMKMHSVVGSGIQFFPRNVVDTRIGPVAVQGGLASGGASRLSVIIGANLSPQVLAREILPLWITATPLRPPGGGASIRPGRLSEVQLAQALLVYNQAYLPVPAMTGWRSGLQLPLPVEIDEATGIATLDPDAIRTLAAAFDPAWTPLLRQRAAATTAPPAADTQAEATAFLAAEPTAAGRGTGLATQAVTNAQASLPLIREVFAQLGAGGFETALAMADHFTERDVGLLAAQRDGAAILALLRTALGAAPAAPTAAQQASIARANAMLTGVAGVRAAAPPSRMSTRAERTVTVDTVYLRGSSHNPATSLAVANMIYAQCNLRFVGGVRRSASAAQTTAWINDGILDISPACGAVSPEELALYQGATTAFGLTSRVRAFFLPTLSSGARGYSVPPYCATGPAAAVQDMAVVANDGDTTTLAHELGHILLNDGGHPADTIMEPIPRPNEILNDQCTTIHGNA